MATGGLALAVVLTGCDGGGMGPGMPRWFMDPRDLRDLIAYLRTLGEGRGLDRAAPDPNARKRSV